MQKKCVSGSRLHTEVYKKFSKRNDAHMINDKYKDSKIFTMDVNGGS